MSDGLLAWSPLAGRYGPQVGGILVHPDQKLSTEMYLSLLSDRMQRLVDLTPQVNARALESALEAAGLWENQTQVDPEEAGSTLIWSNPVVRHRLSWWGLPLNLKELRPVEQPDVRKELEADLQDPISRLENWVLLLARQP